jgi:ribonuclease HI
MRAVLLQVDGTPGTPPRGVAGLGIVVRRPTGQVLRTRCAQACAWTCNEAEYQALIAGLTFVLRAYPGVPVRCMTDSRVVVDQLTGRASVRASALQPLHAAARALLAQCTLIELVAIPRGLNQLADALAWEALRGRQRIVGFGASSE